MIEHLTQNQVSDFCRQQLRPAELLSVSDHLGECDACRRSIESGISADAGFFALRSEVFGPAESSSLTLVRTHPTIEQTAGFVDGRLAGEELQVVVDHLTSCEQCALAVADLRAFSSQIAPGLDREYHPASVAAATEGWWQRATASLPFFFRRSPGLAFGAALTILLLAITSWFVWRTIKEGAPKEEFVVAPTPTPAPTTPPQPAPATVVARLNDGPDQLTLDRDGKLSGADDLPPVYQSKLKEALTNPRIEPSSQLKGLTRPPSSLMGAGKQGTEFFTIEPVAKVLLTDRPTFRWSRLDGATSYIVEVYDEKFTLAATSPQLTNNSWRVPQQLGRGGVYSWQVKAIKDGQEFTSPRPPAPQAKFRVLNQATANELANARRAHPSSHLTLGLLYAEAGLLKEAEQELRLLQKANPESEIARSLVNQIRALRR